MARRANKRDGNEPPIIKALRAVGATVSQLDGTNIPDLVVGFRGVNFLIEIKDPANYGKLSPGQVEWHKAWQGQVAVARTIDEALKIIGAIE